MIGPVRVEEMEKSVNAPASEPLDKAGIPFEKPLSRFIHLLLASQFEHAREVLESERDGAGSTTSELFTHPSPSIRSHLASLVNALIQLPNLEALYHALAFSTPSGKTIAGVTFRAGKGESSLKEGYRLLSAEFSKLTSTLAGNSDSLPPFAGGSIPDEFQLLVQARTALIDFYQALAARDWRSMASESARSLAEIKSMLAEESKEKGDKEEKSALTDSIRRLYEREIGILEELCKLMASIPQFQMLDSLLSLKYLRNALHDWYQLSTSAGDPASRAGSTKKIASPSSQQSSSVSFFTSLLGRKSASSAAKASPSQLEDENKKSVALLNLLHALYQSQLAKFTLYFHDTLAQHSPGGEMRWAVQPSQSNHHYLQSFHSFYKKHQPKLMVLLVNRIDELGTFKGFGYGHDVTRDIWGASMHEETHSDGEEEERSSASSSGGGILEKYPPLFTIPSMAHERRLFDSLYPSIISFVQEGRGLGNSNNTSAPITPVGTSPPPYPNSIVGAGMAAGGAASGTIRYLHDRNKDQSFFSAYVGEANVHLAMVFTDRRVQEKDASVLGFLQEIVGGLRGVRTPAMQQLRAAVGTGK